MRSPFKTIVLAASAAALMTAPLAAHAQSSSAPSSDEHETAAKAVGKMEGSKNGKATNTNKSIPNVQQDQPDQTRTPTAPPAMAPTGETSDKVPQEQKAPTRLMGTHHMHHARARMNPPS